MTNVPWQINNSLEGFFSSSFMLFSFSIRKIE